MPNIGPMELVVVLIVALVILGPKRLPAAGRSLGQGIRGFKETLTSASDMSPAAVEPSAEQATTVASTAAEAEQRPAG